MEVTVSHILQERKFKSWSVSRTGILNLNQNSCDWCLSNFSLVFTHGCCTLVICWLLPFHKRKKDLRHLWEPLFLKVNVQENFNLKNGKELKFFTQGIFVRRFCEYFYLRHFPQETPTSSSVLSYMTSWHWSQLPIELGLDDWFESRSYKTKVTLIL